MDAGRGAQMQAWLDQEDRSTVETVRRRGWAVQHVMGDGTTPSFAYTVGLFGLGHPELVVFSLDRASAGGLLNLLGDRIRVNGDLTPGEVLTFADADTRVRVDELPHPEWIVFAANRYYQRPDEASVPAYQLTWDVDGAFPGEVRYSKPAWMQPKPGTFRA